MGITDDLALKRLPATGKSCRHDTRTNPRSRSFCIEEGLNRCRLRVLAVLRHLCLPCSFRSHLDRAAFQDDAGMRRYRSLTGHCTHIVDAASRQDPVYLIVCVGFPLALPVSCTLLLLSLSRAYACSSLTTVMSVRLTLGNVCLPRIATRMTSAREPRREGASVGHCQR